jgi:Concanavalin A-like lectin/glucanases superfamily/Secretion system C-terminal sorting domain/Fimbrillin-A associated anchor proteins Mfa1 and Mfa2
MKKIVTAFVLYFAFLNFSCAQTSTDSSLVAHFNFDNQLEDQGIYQNFCLSFGNQVFVDGKKGKGLYFDGIDDYLVLPSNNALNSIQKEFTISGWLLIAGVPDFYAPILTKGNTTNMNTPYAVVYRSPETTPYIRIQGDNKPYETLNIADVTNAATLGEWVFFSWTFKDGLVSIYKNGEKVAEHQFNFTQLETNTLPVEIGRDVPGFNTEYLQGVLDEFSIYNKALSDSEVETLYNSTITDTKNETTEEVLSKMEINPNPANGEVRVDYNLGEQVEKVTVRLFDNTGKLQQSFFTSHNNSTNEQYFLMEVSNLPSGTYSLVINGKTKMISKNLVVIK